MENSETQYFEQESMIDPETSSCEEEGSFQEYQSCLSTNQSFIAEEEPTKAEEEPDKEGDLTKEIPPQRTSHGFIMFNVFFVLVMAVLVFMIFESPMVSKEDCSDDLKGCAVSLWKDFRRYFDFYF